MAKHRHDAERLKTIVRSFANVTVTVLADLVADEFVFGEIARVSREAPVLILKHRERTVVPGGGGNAIMNLASLGVKVLPVGVVGDDEPGELLLAKFCETKIPTDGITRLKGHVTTTKTRILAGMSHTSRQQVVRVDREPEPIAADNSIVTKIVKSCPRICVPLEGAAGFRLWIWRRDSAFAGENQGEGLAERQTNHTGFAIPPARIFRSDRGDAQRTRSRRSAANEDWP